MINITNYGENPPRELTLSQRLAATMTASHTRLKYFTVSNATGLALSSTPGTINVPTSTDDTQKEYHIYLPDTLPLNKTDTGKVRYSATIKNDDNDLMNDTAGISVSGNTLIVAFRKKPY